VLSPQRGLIPYSRAAARLISGAVLRAGHRPARGGGGSRTPLEPGRRLPPSLSKAYACEHFCLVATIRTNNAGRGLRCRPLQSHTFVQSHFGCEFRGRRANLLPGNVGDTIGHKPSLIVRLWLTRDSFDRERGPRAILTGSNTRFLTSAMSKTPMMLSFSGEGPRCVSTGPPHRDS
jgi:hypothetical protein